MIPLVNPDGLNFTQSLRNRKSFNVEQWCRNTTASNTTRPSFWYKNVEKEMSNDTCFGANINRNFAYHWQGTLRLYCCYQVQMVLRPNV